MTPTTPAQVMSDSRAFELLDMLAPRECEGGEEFRQVRAYLAARIAELEQRLRLVTEDRDCHARLLTHRDDELAADEKDAARYRWLRDHAEIIRVLSGQVIGYPLVRLYESIHGPDFRGQPDDALDHAMSAAPQPEKE